jgi:hypothetical protein
MRQCLTLALLLHIWLVLMFGNATGTARPGDGVWGRLNVSLSGSKSAAAEPEAEPSKSQQPAQTELSEGAIGQARQQRFGGSVRPLDDGAAKTRPTTPGAAEVGRWREQRALAARPADPTKDAAPAPQLRTLTAPSPRATVIAPVTDLASPATPAPPAPLEQAPLPSATVKVMETGPAAAVSRSKPANLASPLPALPQPLTPLAAEPVVAPVLVPAPVPEPVKLLATPAEPGRQQKSEVTALAPTTTTAPPLAALAASAVAAPAQQASRTVQTNPVPTSVPTSALTAVSSNATPSLVPSVPQPGAPEAGPRLGVDVATPASTAATPPRLNLNLPRGGELSSRGSSGVLQLLPTPPERKSKLSEDMEKAAKEDCRKAYGEQLGLLAVVPLVLDAARANKGCRW